MSTEHPPRRRRLLDQLQDQQETARKVDRRMTVVAISLAVVIGLPVLSFIVALTVCLIWVAVKVGGAL